MVISTVLLAQGSAGLLGEEWGHLGLILASVALVLGVALIGLMF